MNTMAEPSVAPPARRSCPSAPAEAGAALLGIMAPDGRIEHLRTPMVVDADFLAVAARRGPPEARMRFAGRCVEGRCAQWTGHSCGVIERVLGRLAEIGDPQAEAELPACTIRGSCRWFSQSGRAACRACTLVVTDTRRPAMAAAAG